MESEQVEELIRASRALLQKACDELAEYRRTNREEHVLNACEDAWGAFAQILKAEAHPRELLTHRELLKHADDIARRFPDAAPIIIAGKSCAHTLHSAGFYERIYTLEGVEQSLECVRKAIDAIKQLIRRGHR